MPTAEALERDEALGMMRLLLAELPRADRELVRLKYHENLKYQDISKRTGITVGNVGYRLHHLLKGERLRLVMFPGNSGAVPAQSPPFPQPEITHRARQPAPPGLPTIRHWQAHCRDCVLRWVDDGPLWN